ncbi:hypothetical protein EMPS_05922 [Entomortierella parvispora]|uniref:Uncharacterized protein n=1 Tax=Entomortierella parvispora TaxID=205924 RepID=A0A9P3HBC8_9FUNG|nr:hypothetical protein EMPS_05922 [Entomortierella parvispora]
MGACCGKPDRKGQGHVLGGANTSTVVPAGERLGTTAGKAKVQQQSQTPSSQGQTLGGSSQPAPTGELSASALAAQKRAEAAERRGVQQGGGQLAKKLAQDKKTSAFAVQEAAPEPTNTQWN